MTALQVKNYRQSERGSILLLSIVILTVLLVLGSSLVERSQTAVARAAVESRSAKSFQLAEAGIHKALYSLDEPGGWVTYNGDSNIALPGGGAEVTVSPLPVVRTTTQRITLISTGWVSGSGGARRYPHTIRVVAHWDPDYFDFAIFGDQKVLIGNGSVDTAPDGTVAEVGTNAKNFGAIELAPQGSVTGNLVVGYGAGTPSLCVDNKGTVSGSIDSLDMPKFLPSITSIPAGAVELGEVKLTSSQLVLDEGTYHLTGLSISGNGSIKCNGKVRLYIGMPGASAAPTSLAIGGNGIINNSLCADNLVVYCLDNITGMSISGNGALYGGIYAPKSTLTLNAGDVYGALIAKMVEINGNDSQVYYDDSLSDESKSRAVIRSWEVL